MADDLLDPLDPTGLMPRAEGSDTLAPVQLSEEDTIGGKVASRELSLDLAAEDTAFLDAASAAFQSGDNWAYQVYKRVEREAIAPEPDPKFDPELFIKMNREAIPQHLERQFRLAGSAEEASGILQDVTQELRDQDMLQRRGGFSTFVARGLAGIVDLDTPLALISGGAAAGLKGGILATRWGRLASSVAAGGATGALGETISVNAGTTGDWTSIPAAGLAGAAFGVLGGMGRGAPEHGANEALQKAVREFDEYVADGTPLANRDIRAEAFYDDNVYQSRPVEELVTEAPSGEAKAPAAFDMDELELIPDSLGSSVGAKQLNPQGSTATITNSVSQKIIQSAQQWASSTGIVRQMFEKDSELAAKGAAGDAVAKQAVRFHDMLSASPIASDAMRFVRSGSVVAQRVAYDLMESSSGIWRNNRSAAMLKDVYEKQLLGTFMPHYEDAYTAWTKGRGMSWYQRHTDSAAREAFHKELAAELNGRAFDPPGAQRSTSPGIKEAADAMDRWSALDIEIARGRSNEGTVKGYENLKAYSGYMPQKWVGYKIEKLIRAGRTEKDVVQAVQESYLKMHPHMKPDDAQKFASAVVRRARTQEAGMDSNLIGILQQDGREFLRQALIDNGMAFQEAEKLIEKFTGEIAARGQAGHTKGRIDVDMRFTASNGIQLMDLFDTDIGKMVARRARGTSGAAALARKGILSRADRENIKTAILQEQQARGPSQRTGDKYLDIVEADKHLTQEDIDGLFSYFDSGPIAGGISPIWSNMKKITNLALLNQLGLTQIAEFGPQMAAVGLQRWFDHAGTAIREAMGNPSSKLADELRHMSVLVPEDRLFRDDFNLEMDRLGNAQSELSQRLTTMLNRGQRVQGYVSGFYAVRNFQQRVAVTSATDKIMQNMKGLRNDLSTARAEDIGLDAKTFAAIKKYVDNGTVEFRDGSTYKLNFDKWNPTDVENFALSLNRHVNQVVQKAMIGESSLLFHKDGVASLFFHLKSFPMLALEKQALRNLRIADQEALASFFAGLATAGAAFTVRQAINGRTENLDLTKIAKGAIGYSNMTGWLPMWTDPVMNVLGIDSLRFNTYAQGIDNNVFSTPAAFTTVNRMMNIPGAVANAVNPFAEMSNNDIRALQTTPIIGNLYGITGILNAMKD
jgi:hypothetical protein